MTAIDFTMLMPDWNSLDSVRLAHSVLEATALVFFALLVLFDILAHFSEDKARETILERIGLVFFGMAVLSEIGGFEYGQRNDTLSEGIIISLDAKAREADTKSSDAVDKAGKAQEKADKAVASAKRTGLLATQAELDANSAKQDAKKLQFELELYADLLQAVSATNRSPRAFDFLGLANDMRRFPPMKAEVIYKDPDPEAQAFANLVARSLRLAGWDTPREASALSANKVSALINSQSRPAGIRVLNRVISTEVFGSQHVQANGTIAIEPFRQIETLEREGVRQVDANRLVFLALRIGADLKQDSTLPDNFVRIVVGAAPASGTN